jgi:hypothetical protein
MSLLSEFKVLITKIRSELVGYNYNHYKNPNKIYKILDIGIDTNTDKPVIIYTDINDSTIIWTRPVEQWNQLIQIDENISVPRFQKR